MNNKNWEEYYYKNMVSVVESLNAEREVLHKKNKKIKTILIFIWFVIVLAFIIAAFNVDILYLLFLLPAAIFYFIIYTVITGKKKSIYSNKFKNSLIKLIINFFDEDAVYEPRMYVNRGLFNSSGLFSSYDSYSGEDFVSMKVYDKNKENFTNIIFSELYVTKEYEDSKGETSTYTIFKGLFYMIEFNKNFKSSLYLNARRGKKLVLEDMEFNKMFKPTAYDQVEARYILSTSLMERLKKYRKSLKFVSNFKVAFKNNVMYMALATKKNHLETNLNKKIRSIEDVNCHYEEISQLISIVEELNLNLKIYKNEE